MRLCCALVGAVVLAVSVPGGARAQTSATPAVEPRGRRAIERVVEKEARITALSGVAPHIDGVLDDPAWARVDPIIDFVQKDPHEGQPPTERTEVRLIYDGNALYVGAR